MIAPGDTQALPRIPTPGPVAGPGLPTVALTLAPAALGRKSANEPTTRVETESGVRPEAVIEVAVAAGADDAPEPVVEVPTTTDEVEVPVEAESHERIYAEAMATIAALASNWSSAVQHTSGRHRAAA